MTKSQAATERKISAARIQIWEAQHQDSDYRYTKFTDLAEREKRSMKMLREQIKSEQESVKNL